jgi:hypothetical protein
MNDLKETLSSLHDETQAMVNEALDNAGDPSHRGAHAQELEKKLQTLREELDKSDQAQDELEIIWQAVERDLIFLLFEAGEEQETTETKEITADDVRSRAIAINTEAFELVKAVIHNQIDQEERQKRVRELDQRLVDLVGMPGRDAPEVQHALSEADLDLTYAYNGGVGAMSLRVNRYLEQLD